MHTRTVPTEEILVALTLPRERVPLATRVRGSVLLSSVTALRARGYGTAYLDLLDPRHHAAMMSPVPDAWLPIDLAVAHYDACERLGLAPHVIDEIGAESGRFQNRTFLSVLAAISRESGMTPWGALANANTLGARTWTGSSFSVVKLGPKEARLEWIQQPMARYPYFRRAFGAFTSAICGHFAQAFYTRELPAVAPATEAVYRLSWV